MSHLSADRLAALADAGEGPTPIEAEHLARCTQCTEERFAHEALVSGARFERSAVGAPLTQWTTLAAALRDEGLMASAGGAASATVAATREREIAARRRFFRRGVQVAAAFALVAVGLAAGRITAVAGPLAITSPSAGAPRAAAADPAGTDAFLPSFTSPADARAALERYEVAYQHAAAYLAEDDPMLQLESPDAYHTRLVALERAGRTMREAMEEAPYDPVLTGYYLTTLGQREATLRQLNVALPATQRLNSF